MFYFKIEKFENKNFKRRLSLVLYIIWRLKEFCMFYYLINVLLKEKKSLPFFLYMLTLFLRGRGAGGWGNKAVLWVFVLLLASSCWGHTRREGAREGERRRRRRVQCSPLRVLLSSTLCIWHPVTDLTLPSPLHLWAQPSLLRGHWAKPPSPPPPPTHTHYVPLGSNPPPAPPILAMVPLSSEPWFYFLSKWRETLNR